MSDVPQLGLSPQPLDCEGCCVTPPTCIQEIFPDDPPESVQAELYGNAYSTLFAPTNTDNCCSTWSAKVLNRSDETVRPTCFSAGFTLEQFAALDFARCVVGYDWGDRICRHPDYPLTPTTWRRFYAWFAKHPSTGNVWLWAIAQIFDANPLPVEWITTVEGYLDTGLTEIHSGDGPFTVPIEATCMSTVYHDFPAPWVRAGCWSTTPGSIKVTP